MYRWDIQWSGRALHPHRTISGTMVVQSAKVHTAVFRAAGHILDKEGQITNLAIRATRLARVKTRAEIERERLEESIKGQARDHDIAIDELK